MFSVIFPGQGSQSVGMIKELYDNLPYVKDLFNQADDALGYSIGKIILEGPKEDLDLTENTQPAIFLTSYSIFEMIKKESNINLLNAKYFAGHSLGEYSALATSDSLDFRNAIKLLNQRGKAMQTAVPKGTGGMIAVLGIDIDEINQVKEISNNYLDFLIDSLSIDISSSPSPLISAKKAVNLKEIIDEKYKLINKEKANLTENEKKLIMEECENLSGLTFVKDDWIFSAPVPEGLNTYSALQDLSRILSLEEAY